MASKNVIEYRINARDASAKALKKSREALNKTAKAATLMGAAFTAATALIVKNQLSVIDSLAKTSDKLGITTEGLQGLRNAAELSGVATQTMDMALQRMTRRLSEAANDTGEAKDAIKELGLSAKDLANLAPDVAFQKIAGAMENVTGQSDKVRLAFKLFDSEGVALVNTLALGEDQLKETTAEAILFGQAISRVDAAKVEAANDAWTRVGFILDGVTKTLAVELAPFIKEVGERFVDAAKESGGFSSVVRSGIETAIRVVGFLADVVNGLKVVWQGVKVVFLGFVTVALEGLSLIEGRMNSLIETMNLLPGVNIAISKSVSDAAAASTQALIDAETKLFQMLNAQTPGAQVEALLQGVRDKVQAETEIEVEGRRNKLEQLRAVKAEDDELTAEEKAAELEKERAFQEQLFGMKSGSAKAGVDFATKMNALDLKGSIKHGADMIGSAGKTGSALFETQKALSLANIAATLPDAVIKSFNNGGGYPFGLIPAGLMLAAGAQQLAAVGGASFGGARAAGGDVTAGQQFLVGERGPELFVPGASGSVIPNNAIGGGGATIENVNISILENATNVEALLNMGVEEITQLVAGPIMDALNLLDDAGVRQKSIERLSV